MHKFYFSVEKSFVISANGLSRRCVTYQIEPIHAHFLNGIKSRIETQWSIYLNRRQSLSSTSCSIVYNHFQFPQSNLPKLLSSIYFNIIIQKANITNFSVNKFTCVCCLVNFYDIARHHSFLTFLLLLF